MGSVDIVVNNAGILDESAVNKTIDINLVTITVRVLDPENLRLSLRYLAEDTVNS